MTPDDPGRIGADQAAAIQRLAFEGSSEPPAAPDDHHGHHQDGDRQSAEVRLTGEELALFDRQWAAATGAAASLDSPTEASAAGYTRASVQGAGVGVHWVNWTLIDAPFDAARPSMLLFDERVRPGKLVGFSYWVRSTEEPVGFAGPHDVWHQHANLCIVNGWVDRERVASPQDCAGDVLAGSDLWMLHAWVVPGSRNRWGEFAPLHPNLCPPVATTPDIARCPTTL